MLEVAISDNADLIPPAPGLCARRMGAIGSRRRKYIFSAQLDARIRDIYLIQPGAKARPGIRQLADQVGIPHWALKKRAWELGLARTKELPYLLTMLGLHPPRKWSRRYRSFAVSR